MSRSAAKPARPPRRAVPKGTVALADIAREIGMDPKAARARFRRHRATFAAEGLKPKPEWGTWLFEAKLRDRIAAALRGQPAGQTAYAGRLRRVGGSVMVAIPPHLLDALDLGAEAAVELSADAGRLIIKPRQRLRYTLHELLAQCDASAPPTPEEREWLDAPATGRELI